jgi:hypothetical protein
MDDCPGNAIKIMHIQPEFAKICPKARWMKSNLIVREGKSQGFCSRR